MRNGSFRVGSLIAAVAVAVGGCSPVGVAVGAGATVGSAAVQERGVVGTAKDAGIQIQINDLWFKHDIEMFSRLDMMVHEGRVLVTGFVDNEDERVEAVRLAWQADGVQEVINEIEVGVNTDTLSFARDAWITAQLRSQITLDKGISALNYTIDTVAGTIYLIGVAQSDVELQRVVNHARNLAYVKRVVSHVRVKPA